MPFFWVGGLVFSLLGDAARRRLSSLCEEVFEPGATLALLERERATIAAGWPHYRQGDGRAPELPQRDLSSIRAGNLYDILPRRRCGRSDPELRSNCARHDGDAAARTPIDRMDVDLPEALRGSFGRARARASSTRSSIPRPARDACPQASSGEICVRGYSVMQGLTSVEREHTFDATASTTRATRLLRRGAACSSSRRASAR